jgi:hypothetical protein
MLNEGGQGRYLAGIYLKRGLLGDGRQSENHGKSRNATKKLNNGNSAVR